MAPEYPVDGQEHELTGGIANRGQVVRVDHTVRRPQTAGSPAVHAFLRHLEDVGFDGAPRFLGEDEAGREILTYIEGDVPVPPAPAWALSDDSLTSVALLLRRYHAAAESFDPTPHRWDRAVPSGYRGSLVTHNDPNLDNIVFRDGAAVALIDFDLASPACALWEVALGARLWVPLRHPSYTPEDLVDRVHLRLRLFVDAYGLPPDSRRGLVEAICATHVWSYDIIRSGARRGAPGYRDYWWHQGRQKDRRGRRWLAQNVDALTRALS